MRGLWQTCAGVIEKHQRRWATRLTEKTQNLPVVVLKRWLVAFCFVLGSLNIVIAVRAFYEPPGFKRPQPIAVPAHTLLRPETLPEKSQPLSAQQWANLQRYRQYMDSLKDTPSGMLRYDSLQRLYPGLLDSIAMVETLYLNAPKTKK